MSEKHRTTPDNPADAYEFRGIAAADEEKIVTLFPECFFVEITGAHWRWKYLDNPVGGPSGSIAVRRSDGELAAHYAAYPTRFRLDGELVVANQISDIMTAPAHRKVGFGRSNLFVQTALHFYDHYCRGKVAFNYGFHTGTSRKISQRYIDVRPVAPVAFRVRADGSPPEPSGEPYRIEIVTEVDDRFDRLMRRVARRYGLMVERNAEWLRWRYFDTPERKPTLFAVWRQQRLVGWSAFGVEDGRLIWGDALFRPVHRMAAADVLAAALEHFGEVERVECWFPRHPGWWDEVVRGLGFVEERQKDDLWLTTAPHLWADSVERLTGAYYTLGDSDLF
ncbi:MAG: GNAT family N-acetyltransferase [Acidobacteriota bacterium]